jgi:hypothetical protein
MSAAMRVRDDDLFRYVLRLGDLCLVLGHGWANGWGTPRHSKKI